MPAATAHRDTAPRFGAPLPMAGAAPAALPADGVAFDIGLDHARCGLTPPADHLHAGHPVRDGWDEGRRRFAGRRPRATTPAVRLWLQTRLQAWLQGRPVDALQFTPALLRRLAVSACPVTGQRLSQDAGLDTDAVLVALRPDAALSPGHLLMCCRRAAHALARVGHRLDDALALARELDVGENGERRHGLDAAGWWACAVLLGFATPLPHAQAAGLPLRVWPAPRLRLLNPAQALQAVLSQAFTAPDRTPPIGALSELVPTAARADFHVFMHTLLARQVAAGRGDAAQLRRAITVAWTEPLVQRRWTRLALGLGAQGCQAVVDAALARGLVSGLRDLPADHATEGWAVPDEAAGVPARLEFAETEARTAPRPERRRLPRPTEPAAWPARPRQRALPLS